MNKLKLLWFTKIDKKNTVFLDKISCKQDDKFYQVTKSGVFEHNAIAKNITIKHLLTTPYENCTEVDHISVLRALERRNLISFKGKQIKKGAEYTENTFKYKDNDYIIGYDEDFIAKVYKIN
jgi:hypothetical protein